MNDKIKQKYKDLFVTLIEEEDWAGARNLLDSVINLATPGVTISPSLPSAPKPPPIEEQVPAVDDPVGEDAEWQRRFGKSSS